MKKCIINNLILGGGGIKGIAYCGAFKKLHELQVQGIVKLDIQEVCGVSVGSIFGLTYVIGYSYQEMIDEIINKRFTDLVDLQLNYLFNGYGIDSGNHVTAWLETLLLKRGFDRHITFEELYNETKIGFKVCATNLSKYQLEVFDRIKTPKLEVIKAVRMSISLPLIYTIQKYNDDIYVDGGLMNNYPIYLYNDKLETTFGCILLSDGINNDVKTWSFESYIYNVFQCFVIQRTQNTFLSPHYKDSTIAIKTNVDNIVRFKIKKKEKTDLINCGYKSVEDFFRRKE